MKPSKQVAQETGLSIRRIQQWAYDNHKEKIGRDYIFTADEIKQILSTKGKQGRPRKDVEI